MKRQVNVQKLNERFLELNESNNKFITKSIVILANEFRMPVNSAKMLVTEDNYKLAKGLLSTTQKLVLSKMRDGMTQSQIARELNVSRQAIHIHMNGIKEKGLLK